MAATVLARHSLKLRVALSTLAICLVGVLALSFYASRILREEMRQTLGGQQFATVSLVAGDINRVLMDLFGVLEARARKVSPARLANKTALQAFLEDQSLDANFNGGAFVTGTDGTVIASIPVSLSRIGGNYLDRDYMIAALKEGKATIGRPVIGRASHHPVVVMAVPIRDAHGRVIGALAGVIDLSMPNFLDKITQSRYGRTGGFFLNAPQYRMIVTATDKSRIMQPHPAPGVNTMLDRYLQGYEGYGISVNARGIEELNAAKGIPVAGWFLGVAIPTEEAFAPIDNMQQRMLWATLFMCLLATGLTWWLVRGQIAPIFSTLRTLTALSQTSSPPKPLPITSSDEIGQLIGGFNGLLETLRLQQEQLKEMEERWQMALEAADEGVWDWNLQTGAAFYSRRWKEIIGYAEGDIRNDASEWTSRVHPEDFPVVMAAIQSHVDGTAPSIAQEYRLLCMDGSWKWILGRGKAVRRDAQGKALRLVGTNVDITERRRLEEALRLTRFSVDVASDAIFWVTPEARIVDLNAGACRLLGYTREELLEMSIPDIDPHYSAQRWAQHFVELGQRGSVTLESEERAKDGRLIPVEVVANYIEFGGVIRSCGFVRDISARKQVEADILATKNLLQATLDAIPDLLFEVGMDGRIHEYHSSRTDLLLAPPEVFLGKNFAEVLPPEATQVCQSALQEAAENGHSSGKEYCLLLPQGELCFDLAVTAIPQRVDSDRRFIFLARDISTRKQAEDELRRLTESLEDQVKARTARLREVSAQLTLTEERERRMLALELHDNLSQLLAIIRIKLMPLADSEFHPAVNEILTLVDKADQSARMVTRRLSPPILNTMGMDSALKWLVDDMLTTYGLKVYIDNPACSVALNHAIEAVLFRSARELLVNVVKHAKAGHASLSLLCDESRVTLVVGDEGCGFDSFRFREPLLGEHSFGLSSIYERIVNLGGEMFVVSSPGHGSTITLSVPTSVAVRDYQPS